MSSRIRRAVIPAAGLGSRLLPLTKAIPKEMLPVGDKPVIEHTVRELVSSGVTDITIDYHRPRANGRTVFGDLVWYDRVWRAGANDNTTITFEDPVKVEGKDLAAGTYGLHMIPAEDQWTVVFSTNSTSWGSFTYDQAEDALRVTVRPEKIGFANGGAQALAGQVVTRIFQGNHWLYQIDTALGRVTVIRQNSGESAPTEGESVRLTWRPEDMSVRPAEAAR